MFMSENTLNGAGNQHPMEKWEHEDALEALTADHEQAILMDILRDASRGKDLNCLLSRMERVLKEAKDIAYDQGAYE
ncbi:MAG: hypothetical protein H9W81_13425 [Enterococcus sp.]|nr:hypothetical protein [Enterococcus sp.]